MSNLVCKKCKSVAVDYEDYCGGTSYYRCKTCGQGGSKDKFTLQTVFDRITQSPEALAPYFVEKHHKDGETQYYLAKLNNTLYSLYDVAIDATVAKLKEVAE